MTAEEIYKKHFQNLGVGEVLKNSIIKAIEDALLETYMRTTNSDMVVQAYKNGFRAATESLVYANKEIQEKEIKLQ